MKNFKRVLSIILAVVMCLSLASCSMVDAEDTKITNDNIKIGVVIPGKTELGDGEFNDLDSIVTINTIDKLTSFDYGIGSDRFHYKEGVDPSNADAVKEAITGLLNLECNLIFLGSEGYKAYVDEFATDENNQDVKFVCNGLSSTDGTTSAKNVFGYKTTETDGMYLMGIVAGLKAAELKSNVGFVVEDTNDLSKLNNFASGVLSVSNTVKVNEITATDNVANDVDKLVKADCKVIASDFYSEEIDNVANKNNVYFCGYGVENYTDADYEGEDSYLLCAPLFDNAQYYMNVIKSIVDEGETTDYVGNFKLGSVYISAFGDVADGTEAAVAKAETALTDGTLDTTTLGTALLANITLVK